MAIATQAPRRVGLSTAREGARWFYTDVVPGRRPERCTPSIATGWWPRPSGPALAQATFRMPRPAGRAPWAAANAATIARGRG